MVPAPSMDNPSGEDVNVPPAGEAVAAGSVPFEQKLDAGYDKVAVAPELMVTCCV